MRFPAFALLSSVLVSAVVLVLAHCAMTPNAKIRIMEEWRLKSCICSTQSIFTGQCIAESAVRCREEGLEATCGVDGLTVDRVMCGRRW